MGCFLCSLFLPTIDKRGISRYKFGIMIAEIFAPVSYGGEIIRFFKWDRRDIPLNEYPTERSTKKARKIKFMFVSYKLYSKLQLWKLELNSGLYVADSR